jgi:hypothetical protein
MSFLDPKPVTTVAAKATYLTGAVKDANGAVVTNKRFVAKLDAFGQIDDLILEDI